jgi:CPA1 family monovalent cation:H+ antiporter
MTTRDGRPFPYRDLFLFVAFGVIVVTLVGQGLTLPWLLRRLGLTRGGAEERARELAEERAARHQVVEIGTRRLEAMANERTLPEPIVQHVRSSIERQRHAAPDAPAELDETIDELLIEIIAEQRQMLHALLRDGKLSDESRRRLERQLDLEEEALRHGLDVVL